MSTYDAFITYSRKDEAFAAKLERILERYKVPKVYRKSFENGRSNVHLNIFRDAQDLAGNQLVPALKKALNSSEKLIVISSPNSSTSRWVSIEIEFFIKMHGEENVIPVILEGDPSNLSSEKSPYNSKLLTYLPDPLAVDFRESKPESFFQRRKRFLEAKFQILAQIIGVPKSDLIRRYRMRQLASVSGLVIVGLILLGLGRYAYNQNQATRREKAGQLFEIAKSKSTSREQTLEALAYTLEAIEKSPTKDSSRLAYLTHARYLLRDIPYSYAQVPLDSLPPGVNLDSAPPTKKYMLTNRLDLFGSLGSQLLISEYGRYVGIIREDYLMVWDAKNHRFHKTPINNHQIAKLMDMVIYPYLSEELDQAVILIQEKNQTFLVVWQLSTGEIIKRFRINIPPFVCRSFGGTSSEVMITDDGQHIVLNVPCTGGARPVNEPYIKKHTPGELHVYAWSLTDTTSEPSFETNTVVFKSIISPSLVQRFLSSNFLNRPYLTSLNNIASVATVVNSFEDSVFNLYIEPFQKESNNSLTLPHKNPIISAHPIDQGKAIATITVTSDEVFELWIWNLSQQRIYHHEVLTTAEKSIDWFFIEATDNTGTLILSDSNHDRILIKNFNDNFCFTIPTESTSLLSASFSKNHNLIRIIDYQEKSSAPGKYVIQTWDWRQGYLAERPLDIPINTGFKLGTNDAVFTLSNTGTFYSWRLPSKGNLTRFRFNDKGYLLTAKFIETGNSLLLLHKTPSTPNQTHDCQLALQANFGIVRGYDFSQNEKQYKLYLLDANSLNLRWPKPISINSISDPSLRVRENEIYIAAEDLTHNYFYEINPETGLTTKSIPSSKLHLYKHSNDSLISFFQQLPAYFSRWFVSNNSMLHSDYRFGKEVLLLDTLSPLEIDKFWTESPIFAVTQDRANHGYLTFSEHGFFGKQKPIKLNQVFEVIKASNYNLSEVILGLQVLDNNELQFVTNEIYKRKRASFLRRLNQMIEEDHNYANVLCDQLSN